MAKPETENHGQRKYTDLCPWGQAESAQEHGGHQEGSLDRWRWACAVMREKLLLPGPWTCLAVQKHPQHPTLMALSVRPRAPMPHVPWQLCGFSNVAVGLKGIL